MDVKDLTPAECTKIASLLSKNKKEDAISWMYSQPKDDPEAFLLGKEVKSLDQIQEIAKDYEESPAQRLARFDMQAKFREDPLTLMKQREAEKRMELLKNTAKVKKLRRLLTEQKLWKEKKRKAKKRKRSLDKKSHKLSRSPCSALDSSNETSSSGDELLDKFIKIIRHSDKAEKKEASTPNLPKQGSDETKGSQQSNQPSAERNSQPSSSCRRYREPSPHYKGNCQRTLSSDRIIRQSSPQYKRDPLPYNSKSAQPSSSYRSENPSSIKRKLSKEELETRRAQMMLDAKAYEKERSSRSSIHYRQTKLEEEKEMAAKERHGPSFISHMKNAHVSQATIEEGIHRKANSRQRGELNTNFLSR